VSILFIDIVGSTELAERLDPEPLGQILDRYFATCAGVITEQGGMVEKFIGDAVMAAFGVTRVREDDAVRAVRAATGVLADLRQLSADLVASYNVSLETRCGICSGDVMVIAAPGGDFRVIGDAVNTASRLQAAARPGEILIGADTAALVRAQVSIEAVPPLRLKGKTDPVPAWRVTEAVRSRNNEDGDPAAAFIGRADELAELARGFAWVARRGQPGLMTVLGTPGIGKSRLVRQFLATLAATEATVLSSRCPPHGRGLTYTPLAELLHSYPGGSEALDRSLSADPDLGVRAAGILRPLSRVPPAAVSETSAPAATVGVEEIAWAVRYLLGLLARTAPVVMVWEDLHWAEPTLLDLIDDIVTRLPDTPVLVLCAARTELLVTRPSWGGGKPGATSIELGPLTEDQSAALVSELWSRWDVVGQADDDLADRIVRQCDGNPLFVELMLDVFAAVAPATAVPPTIHALLGARLDQLPADERQVLEMAAVAGREFTSAELRDLARADQMDGTHADTLIARLVRRGILRRAGAGSIRFDQSLMRDTAYTFTSKVRRERYHLLLAERFARGAARAPADDSMAFAYHTEAAFLLRRELRPGAPAHL
jgi:class 3 adenylate cyclase